MQWIVDFISIAGAVLLFIIAFYWASRIVSKGYFKSRQEYYQEYMERKRKELWQQDSKNKKD